jgi:hypothetical protein
LSGWGREKFSQVAQQVFCFLAVAELAENDFCFHACSISSAIASRKASRTVIFLSMFSCKFQLKARIHPALENF